MTPPNDADFRDRSELQMIEYGRRMRKERDEARTENERLCRLIADAVRFLDARRRDGIDFPYDSRPLRRLRETADG